MGSSGMDYCVVTVDHVNKSEVQQTFTNTTMVYESCKNLRSVLHTQMYELF